MNSCYSTLIKLNYCVRGAKDLSVLIVVAHPDDEVLGCGATASLLASRGVSVHSCILSGGVNARQQRPTNQELEQDICAAQEIMGLGKPIVGDFPNIEFNVVPHIEMVRFIEEAIVLTKADVVFTHHPGDLNTDHRHASCACQAACRLFQRRPDVPRLRGLHFMEILSSTDWAFAGAGLPFAPTSFVEVGQAFLHVKIEALRAYRRVMRDFPHPRSEEVLTGLAAYRGGQSGFKYAEAFQTAFSTAIMGDTLL